MLKLLASRLLQMIFIMGVISLILFAIFDSDKFKKQIAVTELGGFAVSALSDQDYQAWLEKKGLNVPFYERYLNWAGGVLHGDFGKSFEKNEPVGGPAGNAPGQHRPPRLLGLRLDDPVVSLVWRHRRNEGGLVARPSDVVHFGVHDFVAGNRDSDYSDRDLRARDCAGCPSNAAMVNGWDWRALVLPVLTLVLYDFGYVARMTRASMAEVMGSQYIRTAVLKGLPYRRVIMRHALRNALIAPFTIIVLQLNWLLSGVVVVEVFFQYAGFGKLLLDAALYGDIYVIQAATLVAVFVAVLSQIISDVGYTFLNPRIRFT